MRVRDVLRSATRNAFRSRLRTTLTVLSLFVGAFTLTLTTALGAGVSQYVTTQVATISTGDVLLVAPAASTGTTEGPQAFDPDGLFAVLQGSGIPVYRASIQGMEVEGLETRDHLAFVVSGLSVDRSFQLASRLMPSMHGYLSSLEA